jgi:hypothetical protein
MKITVACLCGDKYKFTTKFAEKAKELDHPLGGGEL